MFIWQRTEASLYCIILSIPLIFIWGLLHVCVSFLPCINGVCLYLVVVLLNGNVDLKACTVSVGNIHRIHRENGFQLFQGSKSIFLFTLLSCGSASQLVSCLVAPGLPRLTELVWRWCKLPKQQHGGRCYCANSSIPGVVVNICWAQNATAVYYFKSNKYTTSKFM